MLKPSEKKRALRTRNKGQIDELVGQNNAQYHSAAQNRLKIVTEQSLNFNLSYE